MEERGHHVVESSLPDEDPVLFDSTSYRECRRRGRELRERWYADVLERACRLRDDPLFSAMQGFLMEGRDSQAPDLFHGRTFSAWVGALEGALERIEAGLDPVCLDYYFDGDAFERDLAAEYPQFGLVNVSVPFELLHGSIAVVPIQELVRSPRMVAGVRLTFPNIVWADTPFDRRAFELGVRHLDESISALRTVSEGAYRSFKESIHSIAFLMLRSDETSTSSRASWPGSILVGLSKGTLDRGDVPFTASLLYHEHAHNKLALYLYARPAGLDPVEQFVSPFKNCCRSAEVILHQVYPITMECAVRLALMRSGNQDDTGALQHLAATACRLELLIGHLPHIEANAECQAMVDRLAILSRAVLGVVDGLVAASAAELRRTWTVERERVNERHVWDIGQSLLRGAAVRDPGLESWERQGEGIRYVYRGVERTAFLETSGYGRVQSRYRALAR
jgi:hypothetical protein